VSCFPRHPQFARAAEFEAGANDEKYIYKTEKQATCDRVVARQSTSCERNQTVAQNFRKVTKHLRSIHGRPQGQDSNIATRKSKKMGTHVLNFPTPSSGIQQPFRDEEGKRAVMKE